MVKGWARSQVRGIHNGEWLGLAPGIRSIHMTNDWARPQVTDGKWLG